MSRPRCEGIRRVAHRRLRRDAFTRALVRENRLAPEDLILPVFVLDGHGQQQDVASMPGVQRRSIDRVRDLLQAEAARGLALPLGVDTLAYLIVRLCESFIYADVISDQKVDVGDAGLAVQLLLSGRVERA